MNNNLDHSLKNEFDLAKGAVRAAQKALIEGGEKLRAIESRQGREWKISADLHAEETLIAAIREHSAYPILSEECGEIAGEGALKWVIDPLDGSANFHRDIPLHCVSVGLWRGADPVLGVTLDITRNDLFTGIVGQGAWHNEQPMRVTSIDDPAQAILCTGFPAAFEHTTEAMFQVASVYSRFGKVRMLGTAALMLTWVAAGLFDCYWEKRVAWWDIAAGVALVKAAGGAVQLESATSDNRVDVIAACNPVMLAAISGEIST